MKAVTLTNSTLVAWVDDCDFERINQHRWYAHWSKNTRSYYARRSVWNNGRQLHYYMHREVLGLVHGDKRQGDHARSGDTLNNTRANLTIVHHGRNQLNQRRRSDNTSGHRGVWQTPEGRFHVYINVNKKRRHLGTYADFVEACAVQEAALREALG